MTGMEGPGRSQKIRAILHLDMDCFYATVEHARLGIPLHVPLAVQQWDGLVAVNYAARAKGVKRFDTPSTAKEKCPDLVLVHVETIGCKPGSSRTSGKVSLERYRQASLQVFELFREFCPQCERASVDEAYFDVTSMVEGLMKEVTDWQAKLDDLLTRLKLVEEDGTKTAAEEENPADAAEVKSLDQHAEVAEEDAVDDAANGGLKRCKLLADGGEDLCDTKGEQEQGKGWPGKGGVRVRHAALGSGGGDGGLSQEPGDMARQAMTAHLGAEAGATEWEEKEASGSKEASHSVASVSEGGEDSSGSALEGRGEEENMGKCTEEAFPVFVLEPRLRILGGPIRLEDTAERSLLAAVALAEKLQETVRVRLGYTLSVGVAHNKLLAKMGSAMTKPLGMTVVPQRAVAGLMRDLPIQKVRLLGGKLGEELASMGFETAGQVEDRLSMGALCGKFGERLGTYVFHAVRGEDFSPVEVKAIPKSMLAAKSFNPTSSMAHIRRWVSILSQELAERMLRDTCRNGRSPHHFHVHYRGEGKRFGQGGEKSKSQPMPAAVTQLLCTSTRAHTAHSTGAPSDKAVRNSTDSKGISNSNVLGSSALTSSSANHEEQGQGQEHREGGQHGFREEEAHRLEQEPSGEAQASGGKAREEGGGQGEVEMMLAPPSTQVGGTSGEEFSRLWAAVGGGLCKALEEAGMKVLLGIQERWLPCSRLALSATGFEKLPAKGTRLIDQMFAGRRAQAPGGPSRSGELALSPVHAGLGAAAPGTTGVASEQESGCVPASSGDPPTSQREVHRPADEECLGKELVGGGHSPVTVIEGVGGAQSTAHPEPCQLANVGKNSSDGAAALPRAHNAARSRQQDASPLRLRGEGRKRGRGAAQARQHKAAPKISSFFSSRGRGDSLPGGGLLPRSSGCEATLRPGEGAAASPPAPRCASAGAGAEEMEVDVEGSGRGEGEREAEDTEVRSQGLGREECPDASEETMHEEEEEEEAGEEVGEELAGVGGRCRDLQHLQCDFEAGGGEEEEGEAGHEDEAGAQEAPGTSLEQTACFVESTCEEPALGQGPPAENAAEGRACREPTFTSVPLADQGADEGGAQGGWLNDVVLSGSAQAGQVHDGVPHGLHGGEQEHDGTVAATKVEVSGAPLGDQGLQGKGESGTTGFDIGSVDVLEQARIYEAIRGRSDLAARKAGASRAHTKGPSRAPSRMGSSHAGAKGHKSKAPTASIKGFFLPKTSG